MTDTIFRGENGNCPCCGKELKLRRARLDRAPTGSWTVPRELLRSIYTTLKRKPGGGVTCRKCNAGTKRALWMAPARRTDPGAVFGPICSKCLSAMNTRSVDESLADLVVYEINITNQTALVEWQARAAHVLQSDLPAPVELVMDLF